MFSFLFFPPFLLVSPCIPGYRSLHQGPEATATWTPPPCFQLSLWCRKSQVYSSPAVKTKGVVAKVSIKHSEMFKRTFSCRILHIHMRKKHTQMYAYVCMHVHICIQTLTTNDTKYNINPIPLLSINCLQLVLKNFV